MCDSGGIQTHNLLIRSQVLYSVELRSQTATIVLNCECKGTANYLFHQTFPEVFLFFLQKSGFSMLLRCIWVGNEPLLST